MADAIEIYPGVNKVVVRGNGVVDFPGTEFELDLWRFWLPASTLPELASATYDDGELVVTVPKDVAASDEEDDGAEDMGAGASKNALWVLVVCLCLYFVGFISAYRETTHIVNREVINALGPKGVLINIGRGPHVDEPEMVSALVEGRLGGAGLDVFEKEPEVPEQLFGLDNVVLLPHVGSGTIETRNAMADLVLGNLEAHFANKPLLTPVV
ncbi:hypothetical protein CASFOL_035149 [Castilleja foliolosa]|uniref:SHSP domain-containing protein n=2 Tax=Castilleja foliolosa TaxID=1961234 RepID=A0ABD3BU58_9LAMI